MVSPSGVQYSAAEVPAWKLAGALRTMPLARVLAYVRKLDDCFGQFLVRVTCPCGVSRHIEPESLARLVGWKATLVSVATRMRCSSCGKKVAQVVRLQGRGRGGSSQRSEDRLDIVDIHRPLSESSPLPDFYKFASLEGKDRLDRFEGMVVRGEFYFAHPYEFNDPFECRPRFIASEETEPARLRVKQRTYFKHMGFSRAEMRTLPQDRIAEGVQAMRDAYRTKWGEQSRLQVFCMATTKDDALLWAHYANGHRGACVHLDQRYVPFAAALEVHYEPDYPTIPILDELPPEEVYRRVLCVKGPEWDYEGEYRVIRYFRSPNPDMDMEWKGQVARASPNAVTGVTLGARISPDNEAEVLAMVTRRAVPIPVWKAEAEEDRFAFTFKRISE